MHYDEEEEEEEYVPIRKKLAILKEKIQKQLKDQISDKETESIKEISEEEDEVNNIIENNVNDNITTSWSIPCKYLNMNYQDIEKIKKENYIETHGSDNLCPIQYFDEMRLPKSIIKALINKKILFPTPIQMIGLPIAFLGKDLIAVANSGSGKTLVFCLTMILFSLEYELQQHISKGEGPCSLVLSPSRELALQISEYSQYFCDYLYNDGYPFLYNVCLIGGLSMIDQCNRIAKGVHMAIATPGRLIDMLDKRKVGLRQCTLLIIDEADRVINFGFEEEIRSINLHLTHPHQTLLFAGLMPRRIEEFNRNFMHHATIVNIARSTEECLNIKQVVEYVKQIDKLPYLLECLQKTEPPVIIFCENKKDVDIIYEYLLLKGVDAIATHGGLSQEERQEAISSFRKRKKDVLIGTDVASKGLDIRRIQHIINYDMPKDINTYIHRVGRTGRSNEKGVATSFINRNQDATILRDLKSLLFQSGQKIPKFLENNPKLESDKI